VVGVEEGKTTSEQEGIYAVVVRDNCFSGVEDRGESQSTTLAGRARVFCFAKTIQALRFPGLWLLSARK